MVMPGTIPVTATSNTERTTRPGHAQLELRAAVGDATPRGVVCDALRHGRERVVAVPEVNQDFGYFDPSRARPVAER